MRRFLLSVSSIIRLAMGAYRRSSQPLAILSQTGIAGNIVRTGGPVIKAKAQPHNRLLESDEGRPNRKSDRRGTPIPSNLDARRAAAKRGAAASNEFRGTLHGS